jgi:hypothetical protein
VYPKDYRLRGQLRTDGRLIVSYPKSGRTWMSYAMSQYKIDMSVSHVGNGTRRSEIGRPFQGIPPQACTIPMVFLHRDPIDTAVSMFYQVTRRDLPKGKGRWFSTYLPLMLRGALPPREINTFVLNPIYGIEKVCAFNRVWLDHLKESDDCLVLRYEDMRANPAEGFQKLMDFWGETSATGAQLAEASSFDNMKAAEGDAKQDALLRPSKRSDPSSAKVRRGKVGGYADELTPETITACKVIAAKFGF